MCHVTYLLPFKATLLLPRALITRHSHVLLVVLPRVTTYGDVWRLCIPEDCATFFLLFLSYDSIGNFLRKCSTTCAVTNYNCNRARRNMVCQTVLHCLISTIIRICKWMCIDLFLCVWRLCTTTLIIICIKQ